MKVLRPDAMPQRYLTGILRVSLMGLERNDELHDVRVPQLTQKDTLYEIIVRWIAFVLC